MRRSASTSMLAGLLLVAGLGSGGPVAELPPGNPLLGDPIDPETGEAAAIAPGAPWIRPGHDDEFGTPDDEIRSDVRGDIDLVIRTGARPGAAVFPPPSRGRGRVPQAVAAPFGRGTPIPFWIAASDGDARSPAGRPVAPDYIEGLPFIAVAFADYDGDGYVGVTHLDGDPSDAALERMELLPVGRRYAVARHGLAEGELSVAVGGPLGVDVALAAAGIAGPFENPNLHCAGCHSWPGSRAADALVIPLIDVAEVAPEGPIISTRLPFLPDPGFDLRQGPRGPVPAHPSARVALQVEVALVPDPGDSRIGEAFTLPLDGSDPSIDVARAFSGPPLSFGLVRAVSAASWRPGPGRALRPGVGADGRPTPVEVLDVFRLEEPTDLRVVALDALGNVAVPVRQVFAAVFTEGDLRIESPDFNGDPFTEAVRILDASGAALRVSPTAGPSSTGALIVEAQGAIRRVVVGDPEDPQGTPGEVVILPDSGDDD